MPRTIFSNQRTNGGTVEPPSDFQSVSTKSPINKGRTPNLLRTHGRTHTRKPKLKVLIACEESQAEVIEFRKLGHWAFSCDIQKCSGGFPQWHIQADVETVWQPNSTFTTENGTRHHLPGHWDLIIAHPPCTFLCRVSAVALSRDASRLVNMEKAREFFFKCLNAPAHYVCVENPIPLKRAQLPPPSAAIQPYQFGEPWSKKTLYWLKNLPPLFPTLFVPKFKQYVLCTHGGKKRSKSFHGVAQAMATQWSDFILQDHLAIGNLD